MNSDHIYNVIGSALCIHYDHANVHSCLTLTTTQQSPSYGECQFCNKFFGTSKCWIVCEGLKLLVSCCKTSVLRIHQFWPQKRNLHDIFTLFFKQWHCHILIISKNIVIIWKWWQFFKYSSYSNWIFKLKKMLNCH